MQTINKILNTIGLKRKYIIINGYKLFLDPNDDSMGLSTNEFYEQEETEFFKQNIKQGQTIIDIGANIGYFTLLFSKLVGDSGKVFAFEPSPNVFEILKRNVEINNCENVVLINKAVSNCNGTTDLFICETGATDNRTYDTNESRKHISISTISLDTYFKHYMKNIDFIKMDTQGADVKVIQGAKNLIISNKNIQIISELYPSGLSLSGYSTEYYLNLLVNLGLNIYNLDNQKLDISSLIKEYSSNNKGYTTILCR